MKKRIMLTLTALSVMTSSAMTYQPVFRQDSTLTANAADVNEPVVKKLNNEFGTIYYYIENDEATITGYTINDGDYYTITVPTEIDGCPVTAIEEIRGNSETYIDGIIFPEGIKRVGTYGVSNANWVLIENPDLEIPDNGTPFNKVQIYGKVGSTAERYAYKQRLNFIDYESIIMYGELMGTESDGEITITRCYKKAKDVIIPSEIDGIPVTTIGMSAFYSCSGIEEITIPDSVKTIGELAFHSCSSLRSVYVSDSVTRIGHGAFGYCGKLNDVRLPDSLTEIPTYCFRNSKTLMEINIPKSCEVIGDYAFADCTYIEKIDIPESVTKIGDGAFQKCWCLEEINLPDTVTYIGKNAFDETRWAEKNLPADGIIIINGCLTDAKNFKGETLEIPDTVHTISSKAFGEQFANNTTLKKVIVPESVKVLDDGCFEYCTALETVELPDTLEKIGRDCFYCCSALESITIPDTVTEIGPCCFMNCSSLKEVHLPAKLDQLGENAFESCEKLEKVELPDTLSEIGSSAFFNCNSLKEITIPSGITEISNQCFGRCTSLEKVSLPEGVKNISSGAFGNCTELKEIELPDTLESISDNAFYSCNSLKSIDIPDNVKIGEYAFHKCEALESMVFPDNVTIGEYAFFNCTSLAEVKLPDNEDFELSSTMFRNTPWLETFRDENGLIIINNKVFDGTACEGDIVIPDGVTEICENAFEKSKITSVTYSDSLKKIGRNAFSYCDGLVEFSIPDGMEEIPYSMFYACTNLTKVTIPDSVKRIDSGAFDFCTGLTEFTVPATVNSVGMAFEYADNLKTITFLNPDCSIAYDGENFLTMPYETTVRGYADSTAYDYAYFSNRKFEFIEIAGDANCDHKLDISDAVLIMQSISNPAKYSLTEQGKINADIAGDGDGVTNLDALAIQKKLLKLE